MNVKNLVLGIGIFVVYMLMMGYGIEAFYPSPKYDSYCNNSIDFYYSKPYMEQFNCTSVPGLRNEEQLCYDDGGQPVYTYDDASCISGLKECNYCNKEFADAEKEYSKVLFVVALILGIITLIVGYGVLSVEPVGSALMASGVGAIFYGSVRNWTNLSDIWRFLLLFVALVLLIWIALRINKPQKKSWQFWK